MNDERNPSTTIDIIPERAGGRNYVPDALRGISLDGAFSDMARARVALVRLNKRYGFHTERAPVSSPIHPLLARARQDDADLLTSLQDRLGPRRGRWLMRELATLSADGSLLAQKRRVNSALRNYDLRPPARPRRQPTGYRPAPQTGFSPAYVTANRTSNSDFWERD